LSKSVDTATSDFFVAMMERVLQMVTQEMRDKLAKVDLFIYYLKNPTKQKQARIDELYPVCMPYDPSVVVTKVHLDQMKQLNTFTKPIVIPMETNKGTKMILLKNEDLRKDRMVVSISYILTMLNDNFQLTPYNVYPVSPTHGWIEMLDDTSTLYDIQQTTTLQNYILNNNATLNVNEIRRQFIKSCGSNCVLTYMLGIGDRNLHNILVTPKGNLINIDFSYILGADPKFNSAEMKITKDMVDTLGGKESEGFASFQLFCRNAYQKIRRYTSFWYTLYLYLAVVSPPIHDLHNDVESIKQFCEERLMTSLTDEECDVRIVDIVNKNSNPSWQQYLSDYSHGLKTSLTSLIFDMEL